MIGVTWQDPQLPEKKTKRCITAIRDIIDEVCAAYKLTYQEMVGARRGRSVALPRQEAYWRCYKETGASFPQIGLAFGGRDHTTIMHGVRAHERRMKSAADSAT